MEVSFKPTFIRQFGTLEHALQEEVLVRIEQFRDEHNHQALRVHKLKGDLKGLYAFSVNYSVRIVFAYESKDEVVLLSVGDHEVYR